MKKIALLCALVMYVALSAQNLTMNELYNLRQQSLSQVDSYLKKKGWSFVKGAEPGYNKMGSAFYEYHTYDDVPTISYLYSRAGVRRVMLRMKSEELYDEYLTELTTQSGRPEAKKDALGGLVKIFKGKTTTFCLTEANVSSSSGAKSMLYFVTLYANRDFETQVRHKFTDL
ncbi:hypothetical protein [Chryseobacterium sp. MFBS3-17]|uniref:hypothetical protein n=1 Tax=Chryseobacterium sp. MFBS3-17 TaxID=2886689 RepID=UPI001D0E1365|nr:hypothetical protein [Chryseobacterium sp. MFBS3-17]MCC2591241.1 hypothetical protein [Chryseobacterium sp. MFBS3-17]